MGLNGYSPYFQVVRKIVWPEIICKGEFVYEKQYMLPRMARHPMKKAPAEAGAVLSVSLAIRR
jgi:hypothetical protein